MYLNNLPGTNMKSIKEQIKVRDYITHLIKISIDNK